MRVRMGSKTSYLLNICRPSMYMRMRFIERTLLNYEKNLYVAKGAVDNVVSIGCGNGLASVHHQSITWTNNNQSHWHLYSTGLKDNKVVCCITFQPAFQLCKRYHFDICLKMSILVIRTQIAKFMGPTWGPPGYCRPQMGPILAPWTLLSGKIRKHNE